MNKFSVSTEVFQTLPNLKVVGIICYNIPKVNKKCIKDMNKQICKDIVQEFKQYPTVITHPRIKYYRDILRTNAGIKSKQFPQSNQTLIKRVVKTGSSFSINPLVDFYNALSIKHKTTAGGFDINELQKISGTNTIDLQFRKSINSDKFLVLGSKDGIPTNIPENELCYAQENTILTRQMAWRQSSEGLLQDSTSNAIFMSEILSDSIESTDNLAKIVLDSFTEKYKEIFNSDIVPFILSKSNPFIEFPKTQSNKKPLTNNDSKNLPQTKDNNTDIIYPKINVIYDKTQSRPRPLLDLSLSDYITAFSNINISEDDVIIDLNADKSLGLQYIFWNYKAKHHIGYNSICNTIELINNRDIHLMKSKEITEYYWKTVTILINNINNSFLSPSLAPKLRLIISPVAINIPEFKLLTFSVNKNLTTNIYCYERI